MTRYAFLLFSLFSVLVVSAQRDTIQVSTSAAVIIFPDNISDRLLGDDITFFMSETPEAGSAFSNRIMKLYYNESPKAKNKYTNLTVITVDGNSYEFTLAHAKNPKQATWYIKPQQAVTNILGQEIQVSYQRPKKDVPVETRPDISNEPRTNPDAVISPGEQTEKTETAKPTKELYATDRNEYYRLRSYYMQFDKAKLPRYYARSGDLFLWLKGVYYNENEIYLQFKIENQEGVDFDLNFLKFGVATAYKKSSSNQKNEAVPVFRYKVPQKVNGNSENHFVVVFEKFSLDRNKVLVVDLDENNGSRNLSLEIDHHLINNPFKIK